MNFNSLGGLSLLRILGSISKTIGIVRQITPIYRDIKPLIEKTPLFLQRLKSIKEATYTIKENVPNSVSNAKVIQNQANGPVFFR